MVVSGDETSLLQYTATWTKIINRGNLFEISDSTFLFFQQVELTVQNKLKFALQSSIQHHMNDVQVKDDIFHSVLEAENVQLYWSILSADICKQEHGDELLREIVDMWIAIRGRSIAGAWLEICKQCRYACLKSLFKCIANSVTPSFSSCERIMNNFPASSCWRQNFNLFINSSFTIFTVSFVLASSSTYHSTSLPLNKRR